MIYGELAQARAELHYAGFMLAFRKLADPDQHVLARFWAAMQYVLPDVPDETVREWWARKKK